MRSWAKRALFFVLPVEPLVGANVAPMTAETDPALDLGLPGIETDVPLAPMTTMRVGGPARQFIELTRSAELVAAVSKLDAAGVPLLLIGGGSNVVISDEGFDGVVIQVRSRGVERSAAGNDVLASVAAGERWDPFVAQMVADGYGELAALSGIPGSVGATPIQNVGAYGHEVASFIDHVEAFDRQRCEVVTINHRDCRFSYRDSRFKQQPDRWLILRVVFRLSSQPQRHVVAYDDLARRLNVELGADVDAEGVRRAVLDIRRSKGMVLNIDDVDTWSVGSFFTNPIVNTQVAEALPEDAPRFPVAGDDAHVKLSAAWLIDHAGFSKGWPDDLDAAAGLSTKHTLAITNRGQASTNDVLSVARAVRDGVRSTFGVELVAEPRLIGCQL